MIQVDDVLLSEALFDNYFVCDLNACKGACCVEGDAGAPLEIDEIDKIEANLDDILPFLNDKGRATIKQQGVFEVEADGEYVTPLNNGKECAFTIFDDNGIAKCGMEAAYRAGKTDFKKPSSCHLYPIRITKLKHYEALNYHEWGICKPACDCGSKLQVKVYQFLKEPLISKYGTEWFQQLVEVDALLEKERVKGN
tara:strand:- start:164 stop:751 length:588 start_codon:yes stop_codon:yes gene_type:complete